MAGQRVADGVHRFQSHFVNWYLVQDGDRFTAVDAGLPPAWNDLVATLRSLGRSIRALNAVILTHTHIDHLGFAERARREAGATVYASEADSYLLPSLRRIAKSERGPLRYAIFGPTRQALWAMTKTAAFRAKPIRRFEIFQDGDTLDVAGSPRVILTPGHTFGHAAFHLPERDVLFTGDAIVTRNPYTGATGPRIVAKAATADAEQALASVDRIAATGAGTLLTGHGEPWTGGAAEAARLAREAGGS